MLFIAFQSSADPLPVNFDITYISNEGGLSTASGTSNDIGWNVSETFVSLLSVTDNTFTGFNTSNHVPPILYTDNLHVGSEDFTFTFNSTISSLLIYMAEDGGVVNGDLDFGITPVKISGEVAISGTRFAPGNATGGVVLLNGINSKTLTHTSRHDGGIHFAFFAEAVPVPEPSTMLLLGSGLIGLAGYGRKKFFKK